ncbi:MFS transporter [Nocardia sp. NPDC046763]|uniref:MFS transporter n=1 Tax=Nocardia sp. NPDC046763 TaxID=3155256 RepID=UPI0033FA7FF0
MSGLVSYVDRATLSIGSPMIREDLHLSVAQMGMLLSVFLWAYAAAQLPIGVLVDKLGPRRLLAAGIVIWSSAQAAAGAAGSFGAFAAARVVLGVGEAPQFPSGIRVIRDWFNVRARGTATGIVNCSSTLGTAVAGPLLTGLMLGLGWRWMFVVMAVAGLVIAALWYAFYREPVTVALTETERTYLDEGDIRLVRASIGFAEWRRLLGHRTTWGMIAGFFGVVYVTWVYTAWLPTYLESQRHLSIKTAGFATAVPFIAGVAGALSGGWLTDLLARQRFSPVDSRRFPLVVSLLGMAACTGAAALVSATAVALAFISCAMFLGCVASSASWAMVPVAAPPHATASLGAIHNFGGYLGGALAPLVTGFVVQSSGSFVPAFLLAAAVAAGCAIASFLTVRGPVALPTGPAALPASQG